MTYGALEGQTFCVPDVVVWSNCATGCWWSSEKPLRPVGGAEAGASKMLHVSLGPWGETDIPQIPESTASPYPAPAQRRVPHVLEATRKSEPEERMPEPKAPVARTPAAMHT